MSYRAGSDTQSVSYRAGPDTQSVSYRAGSDTQSAVCLLIMIFIHIIVLSIYSFCIAVSFFIVPTFNLPSFFTISSFPSSFIFTQFSLAISLSLLLSLQCPAGFDSVVPSLLQRAEAIVGRQFANDSEFLYAVLKLLHRIGTRSVEGHK